MQKKTITRAPIPTIENMTMKMFIFTPLTAKSY